MKYAYFPGCSLKGTGRAYEESYLAVCKALGLEMDEIEDWNCCGATAYMAVDEMKALTLAARNLTLAEHKHEDVVAPCSGCYLVLEKSRQAIVGHKETGIKVQKALDSVGLHFNGEIQVRHPLDVLVNDLGLDAVKSRVTRPLTGLKVAPYYGCQIVRPFSTFDDQVYPMSMDRLFEALGATVIDYPVKTRCCGGSLTGTVHEAGQRLAYILLNEAHKRGADLIGTCCPLCHFNLDSYQDEIGNRFKNVSVPVVYFTQLMGLAFGIAPADLGLQRNIVSVGEALSRLTPVPA